MPSTGSYRWQERRETGFQCRDPPQGIRKYDVVDIFGIVYEMRKERVWMVQTEQQYICIHQVGGYQPSTVN